MKDLLTGPLVAYDLETTGVDVDQDRILTACVALLQPAQPAWNVVVDTWLANPGIDIADGATAVHGITTAYAKEHGADPAETVDAITNRLAQLVTAGMPIVACNAAFDFTLLDRECRRHNQPTIGDRAGIRYLALGRLNLEALHRSQQRWRVEQVKSLLAHFTEKAASDPQAAPVGPMWGQWPVIEVGCPPLNPTNESNRTEKASG